MGASGEECLKRATHLLFQRLKEVLVVGDLHAFSSHSIVQCL